MTTWIRTHAATLVAAVLAVAMLVVAGCQSTAPGLNGEPVTADQLDAQVQQAIAELEAEALAADARRDQAVAAALAEHARAQADITARAKSVDITADVSFAEIQRQDALKASIFEQVGGVVQSLLAGTFSPQTAIIGALGLGLPLLGVGAGVDGVRSRRRAAKAVTERDEYVGIGMNLVRSVSALQDAEKLDLSDPGVRETLKRTQTPATKAFVDAVVSA